MVVVARRGGGGGDGGEGDLTLNPTFYTFEPNEFIPNHKPCSLNPEPTSLNPILLTLSPKT